MTDHVLTLDCAHEIRCPSDSITGAKWCPECGGPREARGIRRATTEDKTKTTENA